jgi:hypothetical protein
VDVTTSTKGDHHALQNHHDMPTTPLTQVDRTAASADSSHDEGLCAAGGPTSIVGTGFAGYVL